MVFIGASFHRCTISCTDVIYVLITALFGNALCIIIRKLKSCNLIFSIARFFRNKQFYCDILRGALRHSIFHLSCADICSRQIESFLTHPDTATSSSDDKNAELQQ